MGHTQNLTIALIVPLFMRACIFSSVVFLLILIGCTAAQASATVVVEPGGTPFEVPLQHIEDRSYVNLDKLIEQVEGALRYSKTLQQGTVFFRDARFVFNLSRDIGFSEADGVFPLHGGILVQDRQVLIAPELASQLLGIQIRLSEELVDPLTDGQHNQFSTLQGVRFFTDRAGARTRIVFDFKDYSPQHTVEVDSGDQYILLHLALCRSEPGVERVVIGDPRVETIEFFQDNRQLEILIALNAAVRVEEGVIGGVNPRIFLDVFELVPAPTATPTPAPTATPTPAPTAIPYDKTHPLESIIQNTQHSVVKIFSFDDEEALIGQGSGFFIGNNGEVITNYHVVEGAAWLVVATVDNEFYPDVFLVKQDTIQDLALLHVDVYPHRSVPLVLEPAYPPLGQEVYTLGFPLGILGMGLTVSKGIVSGLQHFDTLGARVQTDASVSPGSSGGPLLNRKGEVIGVLQASYVIGQNINFAIPTELLIAFLGEDTPLQQTTEVPESTQVSTPTPTPTAAPLLPAQEAPPEQPRARYGAIAGTVTDRETDVPISGAEVTIADYGLIAWTDRSGGYILTRIPAGDVRLYFNHLDFEMEILPVSIIPDLTISGDLQMQRSAPTAQKERDLTTPELPTETAQTTLPASQAGELFWKYQTGERVSSSPAVSGDTVYIGSGDHHIYALDAQTGKFIWKYQTGERVSSSPAVSGDTVYIGSNDGRLYALDASSGEEIWSYKTRTWVSSSPLVFEDTVYVGSWDNHLYALDAYSGELRWKHDTAALIKSTPAIFEDTVYIGSWYYLHAIDRHTGDGLWRYKTGGFVDSSPFIFEDTVYIGSLDRSIYALNARTGELRWRYEAGSQVHSSPFVSGDTVYVGCSDRYLYALCTQTGELRWRHQTGGAVHSSPTVSGDTVYVGSDDGHLYAIWTK